MRYYQDKTTTIISEIYEDVLYTEKWISVIDYEGYYEISSFGRIKSLDRKIIGSDNIEYNRKGKFLAQSKDKDGYLQVNLSKNNIHECKKVHRLVGESFIKNTNNYKEINHIKGIKIDNRFHQLEWCTGKQNTIHSFMELGRKSSMKGKHGGLHHNSKKVYCPTLSITFGSAAEAERELGLVGVGEVCNGNLTHAKGLTFRYI